MKHFQEVPYKHFTNKEVETWNLLFSKQIENAPTQIHPIFLEGVKLLDLNASTVPNIYEVNKKLKELTGFIGVPVVGLEEDESFYAMLAERKFPIGNFIRDRNDLSYTPAPDVFHDLYGHLPFLTNRNYADFCAELGKKASSYLNNPKKLKEFARLFWYGVEFSIVKTPNGKKIFGAGIASSFGECAYALSDKPNIIPFNLEQIKQRDFKIDEFQSSIFLLDSPEQLYGCLSAL